MPKLRFSAAAFAPLDALKSLSCLPSRNITTPCTIWRVLHAHGVGARVAPLDVVVQARAARRIVRVCPCGAPRGKRGRAPQGLRAAPRRCRPK